MYEQRALNLRGRISELADLEAEVLQFHKQVRANAFQIRSRTQDEVEQEGEVRTLSRTLGVMTRCSDEANPVYVDLLLQVEELGVQIGLLRELYES